MSPSWRTIPPISWTSNIRWSDERVARLSIDAQLAGAGMVRELERFTVGEGDLRHLDPLCGHRPEVAVLPLRGRQVRRAQALLDGVGEGREIAVAGLLADDHIAV